MSESSTPRRGLLWNPYFHIALAALLNAGAQLLLKTGADQESGDSSAWSWLGLAELRSGWTWLGILALVSSFGSWLYALRFVPLGLAFNLTNSVHILVPLGSWWFLREEIGPLRAGGISLILLGLVFIAQSVAKIEGKL